MSSSNGRWHPGKAASFAQCSQTAIPSSARKLPFEGNRKPFRAGTARPTDGHLCLLGRDTGLWSIKWTLAKLLERQLANALNGTGVEDPQGEPMEFWWHAIAPEFPGYSEGSFMLIDSKWDLGDAVGGTIKASCSLLKIGVKIQFRGVVDEIRAHDQTVLQRRTFPLPPHLRTKETIRTFPWSRVDRFAPPPADGWQEKKIKDQIAFKMRAFTDGSPAFYVCDRSVDGTRPQ